MKIYWTYSKPTLRPSEVHAHEKGKIRLSSENFHIGGLGRTPFFTHCITEQGYMHVLNPSASDIHIALIGGVDEEYRICNTATSDQLLTLSNLVRFYQSLGHSVEEGDLINFDLQQWLKAINK